MSRFTSRTYRRWRLAHGGTGVLITTGAMALPQGWGSTSPTRTPEKTHHGPNSGLGGGAGGATVTRKQVAQQAPGSEAALSHLSRAPGSTARGAA